jgi:RNA polymerase sigma-70 factor (ECF subfamily)
MADPRTITRLLLDWGSGDETALGDLTPLVYAELHALARTYLRRGDRAQTLQPTELIGELYLRLIDPSQKVQWENRSHFFGIAARLMRLVLVDHARIRRSAKRGGDLDRVTLNETLALSPGRPPDVLEVDQALSRLAALDERKARVIELRYFGGMKREEIAVAMRLTTSTVKRDLRLGEAWLRRALTGLAVQPV